MLDGWGLAPAGPGNAVSLADTPVFDELWERYPHTQLDASGTRSACREGQMGNSEVGHLNLGAGTVVKQDLVRIDEAIADGSFFENEALRAACASARETAAALHLIGLVSAGGVHSSLDHLRACIELAARERVPELVLHAFTDGRDTPPTSAPEYLAQAEAWLAEASASGAAAADRDRDGPLLGHGPRPALGPHEARLRRDRARRGARMPTSAQEAVEQAYERGETDEFIQPTVIGGEPRRAIRAGRQRADVQLPPRPDAPDRPGAGGAGLRRVRPRASAPSIQLTTMTRTRRTGPTPSRSSRRGRRPRSPPCSRSAATGSCTWPRPRSTRT